MVVAAIVDFLSVSVSEILSSPLNIFLVALCAFLVYSMLPEREVPSKPSAPRPPPLEGDMDLAELRKYDGKGPDGRICLAVNGKIFDVTRGKDFYGPGGPYSPLAGHDATRALGTMVATAVKDEHDDISDLDPSELEEARGWEADFSMRYPLVGKLLSPENSSKE